MDQQTFPISLQASRPSAVKYLNDTILAGKRKGYQTFSIAVKDTPAYPNACAPIAGVLDYYRMDGSTFHIQFENPRGYVAHTGFDNPSAVSAMQISQKKNPLDTVWKFQSSAEVNQLVNAFLAEIRQADLISPGVITSMDWCLNETMDNVLQHAQAECGYIMGQLHQERKRISFCIFDTGIGIYNSLRNSKYQPPTPLDAITLALQEKVTRDENVGQGNGLWGLSKLVSDSQGTIRISSAGAVYMRESDGDLATHKTGNFNLGKAHGTTLVDFQMDYSQEVDVAKALNGYTPTDYWLENAETENGDAVIRVARESSGTGTRQAAEKLRTLALNTVFADRKRVILDFSGVNLVSSSYADELVGKTIGKYGFGFFLNHFAITNLSNTNTMILNRSVQQRMAQTYYNEPISESDTGEA